MRMDSFSWRITSEVAIVHAEQRFNFVAEDVGTCLASNACLLGSMLQSLPALQVRRMTVLHALHAPILGLAATVEGLLLPFAFGFRLLPCA